MRSFQQISAPRSTRLRNWKSASYRSAIRNRYQLLDPYMRARKDDVKSYAVPQAIGKTMVVCTDREVVESRNPYCGAGDEVQRMFGWAETDMSDDAVLPKLAPSRTSLAIYPGAVAMPGMTA